MNDSVVDHLVEKEVETTKGRKQNRNRMTLHLLRTARVLNITQTHSLLSVVVCACCVDYKLC